MHVIYIYFVLNENLFWSLTVLAIQSHAWEIDRQTKVNNRPTFITIEYIIYIYTVDVQ